MSLIPALCWGVALVPALFPASQLYPGQALPCLLTAWWVPVQLALWLVTILPHLLLFVCLIPKLLSRFPRLHPHLHAWSPLPAALSLGWPSHAALILPRGH